MDSRDSATRNDSFAAPLIYRHVATVTPCAICRSLCHITVSGAAQILVEAECGHFAGLDVKGERLVPVFTLREQA